MSLPHTLHIGRPDGVINWRMPLRLLLVNLSLLALCLAMAVAALCYGTLQLSLEQVLAALSGEAPKNLVTVVTQWRLPRIAMALLLGAALGMSGAIFQSIIRNPLGSPDVIGFNMGAYTGALIAITLIVFRQQRLTIRQQAKAIEAEKATRTKNAFLGAIGHELRTSLQSVMSAIDVLVNTRVSAEHADTFQRLETAAQQIESQMKDLTDYAHLDSGMMELRIVPFDAQKLIAETANEIATLTRKEQVKLSCEVECSHLLVHSDPLRIRQIIVNLLTNAYKYTESGSITLHSCLRRQPGGSSLIIEVTDTGIGIEKDQLDQIFKPFTQLDQSHTKQYAGVGMGLAIVHGLVTLLDGTITVYSEIKKGSTFIVSIPVQISEDERADAPAAANASLQQKPQQVLVVDDNKSVGDAFAALLDKLGYQHELCDSPERALQKLLRRPYDALLLDLQMPGIDGAALARQLRNRRGPNRHVPIIGISAYTPEQLTADQRALFDNYLMKPVRLDALSNALAEVFPAKD